MEWMLVIIALESANPIATDGGIYADMATCFEVREYVMEHPLAPRPAQAVCVEANGPQEIDMSLLDPTRPRGW